MTTDIKSFLLFFILLSSTVFAQQPQQPKKIEIDSSNKSQLIKKSKWEGGFLLGGTIYTGDIEWALPESRPIFGLFLRRSMSDYFAVNASLSQGFLSGSESHSTETQWRVARNISFKSSLTELSLRGELHFLGNTRKVLDVKSVMDETSGQTYKRRARLMSPFVYVGGGVALLKPKTDFNDNPLPNPIIEVSRIAADKAKQSSQIIPFVPFGGGLRIPWVNKQAYLTIEGGFRPTFSDYVDGMSISGNPNVNDWYFIGDIGLSKYFGNKKDSDGDGIADKQDHCPFMKGDLKYHGCPDQDNDGVVDDKDACPTVAGLNIYEGCPDTDSDGIIDKYDDCPTIVGLGQFKGCPSEKVTRDSTGHIISYGLDTVKTVVDAENIPLKSVGITKTLTQNDSLSLGYNMTKPSVIPPHYNVEKNIEKTDESKPDITVIEPEPVITDTTVALKVKPIETIAAQKETPQSATDKNLTTPPTDMTKATPPIDTAVAPKVKPIETIAAQKETPQSATDKNPTTPPTDMTKATPPIDTVVAPKVKPIETIAAQKETPQSATDKKPTTPPTDMTKATPPTDTVVAPKVKPIETIADQKETPQSATDKNPTTPPTDMTKATPTTDTAVAPKVKPIETIAVQKETPQSATDKNPTTPPTDMTKATPPIDTAVAPKVKPIETIAAQNETPQYEIGRPMGHPTLSPIENLKPVTAIDSTVSTTDKPTEMIPFPTNRRTRTTNIEDTTNAFNIVRNNYTISPIYFETKKTIYKPESFVVLDHIAQILLDNPSYTLVIKGFTDITGTIASNQVLSTNRAKTCYVHLIKRGVPAQRMSFKGFGSAFPVAGNKTEASRQLNRRVEFVIIVE